MYGRFKSTTVGLDKWLFKIAKSCCVNALCLQDFTYWIAHVTNATVRNYGNVTPEQFFCNLKISPEMSNVTVN